ncbi:MAG: thioredoxin-dependent thiol peroxidase [Acidobacteria bacterium]|nr:MAG: thioredoxin-dependent thiol peroxidase [Acidobacteriota bacterium]
MTLNIKEGQIAPDFTLPNEQETEVTLSQFKGKWVVLYFYPRDLTPGCTVQAIDFSTGKAEFEESGAVILGVSPDTVASHQKFCNKKDLTITLLSDPEKEALNLYGVWQMKKMAGREYMGVVRSTVLIDPEGIIVKIWEKVRVKGHVETVLKTLREQ